MFQGLGFRALMVGVSRMISHYFGSVSPWQLKGIRRVEKGYTV